MYNLEIFSNFNANKFEIKYNIKEKYIQKIYEDIIRNDEENKKLDTFFNYYLKANEELHNQELKSFVILKHLLKTVNKCS